MRLLISTQVIRRIEQKNNCGGRIKKLFKMNSWNLVVPRVEDPNHILEDLRELATFSDIK